LPLDRPVASLSGGERTRVALARLLIERRMFCWTSLPTILTPMAARRSPGCWRAGRRLRCGHHDRGLLERVDRIVELSPSVSRSLAAHGPVLPNSATRHAPAP